jgi:hypothetical protein
LGWFLALTAMLLVSLRMAIEMRRSRGAIVLLGLGLLFFAIAATVQLGWLLQASELSLQAVVAASLAAHWLVWASSLVYARHVYLDAQGLLIPRPARAKKAASKEVESKKPVDAPAEPKQVRVDAAHGQTPEKPAAAAASGGPLKAAMISAATNKTPAANVPSPDSDRRLSKAERKRLRRQGKLDEEEDE